MEPIIEYKVTAHQATGDYSLGGAGGVEVPPVLSETVDTYIDMLPMHSATKHLAGNTNFMERLRVPVICNNLERALFLSLRYQFVTPLTSLVVIKPDTIEKGDIAEADLFNRKIQLYSSGPTSHSSFILQSFIFLLILFRVTH